MVDERLAAAEARLASIETDMNNVKNDIHKVKNDMQVASGDVRSLKESVGTLTTCVGTIKDQNEDILHWVTGANTVFGFAKKHWKRILVFGAGFMTAAGFGNPKVNAFIAAFMGG